MIVALWLACTSADPEPSAGHRSTSDAIEDTASGSLPRARLDDAAWLRRVSFDLRGVPPTTAELDELNDDPSLAPNLRDAMMHSARFESRMVNALAERWHTRVDEFDIVAFDYGLPSSAEYEFERAVGEEPLRLLARIGPGPTRCWRTGRWPPRCLARFGPSTTPAANPGGSPLGTPTADLQPACSPPTGCGGGTRRPTRT